MTGSLVSILVTRPLCKIVQVADTIYYLRQVNEVNVGDSAFVRCVCVCVCVSVCALRTCQSHQLKTVKAMVFKFDVHVYRYSPDMTPQKFSKRRRSQGHVTP